MIDNVALTTDLWKNKGLEHFIVLTAHFFDQQFNYVSIVVSFDNCLSLCIGWELMSVFTHVKMLS